MELTNINEALNELLSVTLPWEIGKIELQPKNKVVDVFITFKKGSKFKCSNCGKECNAYDTNERRWRHLDLFEYRCYLNIKIPRTNCPTCGVKVINQVPWGRINSHYSFF
jgi:transposase